MEAEMPELMMKYLGDDLAERIRDRSVRAVLIEDRAVPSHEGPVALVNRVDTIHIPVMPREFIRVGTASTKELTNLIWSLGLGDNTHIYAEIGRLRWLVDTHFRSVDEVVGMIFRRLPTKTTKTRNSEVKT
jgi:hypothetical protein